MSMRLIVSITLVVCLFAPLGAAGPFGFRRPKRSVSPNQAGQSSYRRLLNSPERMTAMFGPSILIRDSKAKPKSRFVTQPR